MTGGSPPPLWKFGTEKSGHATGEHLQKLSDQLNDHFKDDLRKKNEWIRDPCNVKLDDPIDIPIDEMASLMEVKCDGSLTGLYFVNTLWQDFG